MNQTRAVTARPVKVAATRLMVAAALVLPFVVLELVNAPAMPQEFPKVLFSFMFLHALLIAATVAPAVSRLHRAKSLRALEPLHWAGLAVGAALLWIYVGVVVDQWHCFIGLPNCD